MGDGSEEFIGWILRFGIAGCLSCCFGCLHSQVHLVGVCINEDHSILFQCIECFQ